MTATTLAGSAAFPEVLGEMPPWSDQAAIPYSKNSAIPRVFLIWDEDDLAKQALPNEQHLWATLGTWDL